MSQAPSDNFLDDDSFFHEILSSQSDLENEIQSLKMVIKKDSCTKDKIGELQSFLSNNNIRNATIDILDEKIFSVILSNAQIIYSEIIKSINETLQIKPKEILERIKNQLNNLVNLLKCWDLCINHIKALEKLTIIDVKNFTVSLFEVTISTLNHCKTSAKDYGDYFQSITEVLATVFRQCVNILNSFYNLLDSTILFDKNQENQMKVLLSIVEETGKIATLLCGMDTKTLTDMWKRFGKLSTNYNLQLKNIAPNIITNHLKGLSENITDILSTISQKNQRSINERSILCCRVLLKILEKLSDTYCGWIRNDAMIGIIAMIAYSYRYTEECLKVARYNADYIKFIETNFIFMIEPFLDVIFKNDSFRTAFFEQVKNIDDNVIGYHLLLLIIIKKISILPYETQREWCSSENSVIDICFQNIDKLTKEICLGELKIQISRNVAQGKYSTSIYEATCLSIFLLVCQISSSDFSELVVILLKYLLGGKFFSALLSTDIWCFVCRLGSSDLCYGHFKYLMQVYQMLKDRKNNINVIVLANLLSRQYTFLSDKDKIDVINNIKKEESLHGWNSIAHVLDSEKKKVLQQHINTNDVNCKISNDLKSLEEQPTLDNLSLLINDLSIISVSGVSQEGQSIDTFTKMWNKIVRILGDCEGTNLLLLESLAISLLHATCPQQGQSKYRLMVLESLCSLYPYASSALRLEFCRILERWASQINESEARSVAELFIRLLDDPDVCVQQQAFEAFEHMTHKCSESVVLSAVALGIRNSQSRMSRVLPAYISAEVVHQLAGFNSLEDYFSALCKVSSTSRHTCRSRSLEREEKQPRLDSDTDSTMDLQEVVERVCRDMEMLVKFQAQINVDMSEILCQSWQKYLTRGDG